MKEKSKAALRKEKAIAFFVYSPQSRVSSFCYRVWAQGTSFYVKLRETTSSVKLSVHGPDERPEMNPGLKFSIAEDDAHEKNLWRFGPDSGMRWFPGAPVVDQVVHVARIRVPWSVMQPGAPSARVPGASKDIGAHLKIRPPQPLHAVDVDLYLSENGKPYWPDLKKIRVDNAGMGPLKNDAGQILTAVSTHRSLWKDEETAAHDELCKLLDGPRVRMQRIKFDETGFMWMHECVAPASMLRQYSADELKEAARVVPSTEWGNGEQ